MTRTSSPRVETPKSASDGKAKATTKSRSGRSPTEALTPSGTGPVQLDATDPGPAINPVPPIAAAAPRQTKAALLRARLAAPGGVSLAELMELTGWQAHTLRAALTGLRKSGLAITRRREGSDTVYAFDSSTAADLPAVDPGIDASAPAVPSPAPGDEAASLITEPGQGAA